MNESQVLQFCLSICICVYIHNRHTALCNTVSQRYSTVIHRKNLYNVIANLIDSEY